MKFLKNIIGTSYDCTVKEPNRNEFFVYCKLVEETCELSDVYHGIAESEPLNGEIADVIISAVDLLYVMDFNSVQLHGSMTRDEIIDSVIHRLAVGQGVEGLADHLENEWFHAEQIHERALPMIQHLKGRITRLLNQPYRSKDNLEFLISQLISYTANLAMGYGIQNKENSASIRIKVEHAIEHKVQKWRGKFGL